MEGWVAENDYYLTTTILPVGLWHEHVITQEGSAIKYIVLKQS